MGFPNLSPYQYPHLICSHCGREMRVELQKMANGRLSGAIAYCDTARTDPAGKEDKCQYGFEVALQHVMGQNSKYVPRGTPVPNPISGPKAQDPTNLDTIKAPAGQAK